MSKKICPYFGVALVMGGLFAFMTFVMVMPVFAQMTEEPAATDELVSAETTPTANLTEHFATATEVEESTSVEGVLDANASDFFKMPLNAGYQMKVFGNANYTRAGGNVNWLEVNLYQEGGNLLSTDHNDADGVATTEAFYYKGLTTEDPATSEMVYVEVKNRTVSDANVNPINYQVNFERMDRSDAFANTDAGPDFDTAIDLQLTGGEGSFEKNFIGVNSCGSGKYCSTDEMDYYMLSLAAGDSLKFEVTPSAEMSVNLDLYDENREDLTSARSTNPGAITELEYISDAAQAVYVVVSSNDFGSYSMNVSVAQGGGAATTTPTETPAATPATTETTSNATPATDGTFNIWDYKWYLAGAGGAIILIIIVVIMMRRGKKGPVPSQQVEIEKLREKMRTGGKAAGAGTTAAVAAPGATRTMHSDMRNVPTQRVAPPPPRTKSSSSGLPGSKPPPMKTAPSGVAGAGMSTPPKSSMTKSATPKSAGPPLGSAPKKGAPPGSLPKAPAVPKAPGKPVTPVAPAGPKRVPEPTKPAGPPRPAAPKPPPSPKSGGAPPQKPSSPPKPPTTGQVGKPGQMTGKAQQDIDDIFGS